MTDEGCRDERDGSPAGLSLPTVLLLLLLFDSWSCLCFEEALVVGVDPSESTVIGSAAPGLVA